MAATDCGWWTGSSCARSAVETDGALRDNIPEFIPRSGLLPSDGALIPSQQLSEYDSKNS
jgi:hypothetical protein